MDMGSLLMPGGSAAYGLGSVGLTDDGTSYVNVLSNFYSGANSIVDVAPALLASMPIIPLLYRSSVMFYSDKIEDIGDISSSDIFLSLEDYKFK